MKSYHFLVRRSSTAQTTVTPSVRGISSVSPSTAAIAIAPKDRFHKGALARAVFSHDAEVVARKDLKIKVLQNRSPIVS